MAVYTESIGEFREGKEEWLQYAEYLDHFLLARNGIKDTKKINTLLAVIGLQTYCLRV